MADDIIITLKAQNEVSSVTGKITADFDKLGKKLSDVEKQAGALNRILQGIGQGIGQAGFEAVQSILGSIVESVKAFAASTLEVGGAAQQAEISFGTLLGSVEAGKAAIADLQQFAANTPFEFPQVRQAGQSLLAFGFQVQDLEGTLTRIGNVAAGVGTDFNELAVIYGKARVQGRLFAEDINQLTERGIPIIQELAEQFAVTESQVRKLVEEGQVGFPQLEQAFISLTAEGGQFFNLMESLSKSIPGQISNLVDSITLFQTALFNAFEPAIAGSIDAIASSLKAAGDGEALQILSQGAQEFADALAENDQLAQEVGDSLARVGEILATQVVDQIREVTAALEENPQLISEFADGVANTIDLLGNLANVTQLAFDRLYAAVRPILASSELLFQVLGTALPLLDDAIAKLEGLPGIPVRLPRSIGGLDQAFADLRDNAGATGEAIATASTTVADSSAEAEAAVKAQTEALKEARSAAEELAKQTFDDTQRTEQQQADDEARARERVFNQQEQAREAAFNEAQRQSDEQLQGRLEQQEAAFNEAQRTEQERFNQRQQQAEALFRRNLDEERQRREEEFSRRQTDIDRQVALETARTGRDRAELQRQFRQEDEVAAVRERLEAGLIADREASEKELQAREQQFREQQQSEEEKFQQAQQQAAEQFQSAQQAEQAAFDAQQQASEAAFKDQQRALQQAFDDAERERDRQFEDEQRQAERAFKAEQRQLDLATAQQIAALQARAEATPAASPAPIPGRRSGGPVTAGQPYWVGEAGKEIFVPTVPGRILTHRQSVQIAHAAYSRDPIASLHSEIKSMRRELQRQTQYLKNPSSSVTQNVQVSQPTNPTDWRLITRAARLGNNYR